MKSGSKKETQFTFNVKFKDYEGMHKKRDCAGQWAITFTTGGRFTLDALGPIALPLIPLVTCHTCQSSYEMPKFREFIEGLIAKHLIESSGVLNKKQIRFLRLHFGLTQDEFAKHIGVSDKYDMAKIESESTPRYLDTDRQVRLKLFGAKLLGIKDTNKILGFNDINESMITQIPESIFPKSESDLAKKVG